MSSREDSLAATSRTLRALSAPDGEVERREIGQIDSWGNVVRTSLVRRAGRPYAIEIAFHKPNIEKPGELWFRGRLVVADPARLGALIEQLEDAKRALEAAAKIPTCASLPRYRAR